VNATQPKSEHPFNLVVTGEAETWQRALDSLLGPRWLRTYRVNSDRELISVVEAGLADAAVLDEDADWSVDVLGMLRMLRRMNQRLPVVVVTRRQDRRWLETALQLTAFSVVCKPLELEELLRQLQRIMLRMDRILRERESRN
jgi:DNA-binding NtrC family response regulator